MCSQTGVWEQGNLHSEFVSQLSFRLFVHCAMACVVASEMSVIEMVISGKNHTHNRSLISL